MIIKLDNERSATLCIYIYRFLAPFSTAVEIYGGGEPAIKWYVVSSGYMEQHMLELETLWQT